MGQSFANETRTARKPHQCFGCAEDITPGTKYETWMWAEDGRADRIKMHIACVGIFHELADDDGWAPGSAIELLRMCSKLPPGIERVEWPSEERDRLADLWHEADKQEREHNENVRARYARPIGTTP